MNINNPPKFWGILVVIIGLFILVAIGKVPWGDIMPVLTLIVGYLVGNGVAAKNGESVEPILGRKKA